MLRDRQLLFLLIVPPVIEVWIFGFALKPIVHHVTLAVADESRTPASRELLDAFTDKGLFEARPMPSARDALTALRGGLVDAALVIPPAFDRDRLRGTAHVQLAFDGVNSFIAGTGAGYAAQILDD